MHAATLMRAVPVVVVVVVVVVKGMFVQSHARTALLSVDTVVFCAAASQLAQLCVLLPPVNL